MRIFEDILDDITVDDIQLKKASLKLSMDIDDDKPYYNDASYWKHQFYLKVDSSVPTHVINKDIEKLQHILDSFHQITEYSDIIYFTLKLFKLDMCPNAQRSFCEDVDEHIAFSTIDEFRNVRQLFRFIMKLDRTFNFNYGPLLIYNSSNNKWCDETNGNLSAHRIELFMIELFTKMNKNTGFSDKYHYFAEAYKTAQVFFGSPEETFRQFMIYYPDITKLMMFETNSFNMYEQNAKWFDIPEFDEKVSTVKYLDVDACANTEQAPVIKFLDIHAIPGQLYIQASSLNYRLGPNSVKKFMDDTHPVNYAHKFVIERSRLRFISYLGLSNEETPKMLFAELTVDLSHDRNYTDVTSLMMVVNTLYGNVLGDTWRDVQDIVDKIIQTVNISK